MAQALAPVAGPAAKGACPVRVQVQVANQQRRVGTSYRKESTIQPKIVLDGVAATKPVPPLEATMLVITMDTRAKYKEKREVFKVETTETLPIPEALNGARRSIEFAPSVVSFDSWRDTTNVGGAAYKYYIFGLRDPETKEILDFQTNHPGLAALAKSKPERREEFLTLEQGKPFPATVK
jgi:hypothetical protein